MGKLLLASSRQLLRISKVCLNCSLKFAFLILILSLSISFSLSLSLRSFPLRQTDTAQHYVIRLPTTSKGITGLQVKVAIYHHQLASDFLQNHHGCQCRSQKVVFSTNYSNNTSSCLKTSPLFLTKHRKFSFLLSRLFSGASFTSGIQSMNH